MFSRQTISVCILAVALSMVCVFVACKKKTPEPPQVKGEVGVASWYGVPFHGRLTASGEVYDMEKMTAAHRTLPFGTVVRVHSLVNQKTTEIRINDRGPFVQNRIIDLSHAAAQQIDMPGIANVQLEIISKPPTRGVEQFAVQVGDFTSRDDAARLRDDMQKRHGTASLVFRPGDQTWRVLVGMESSEQSANALAQQLTNETGPAFVVLVDSDQ
jgi:rare lipoprotein A